MNRTLGRFIDRFLRNSFCFELASVVAYLFFSLVFAAAGIPAVFLLRLVVVRWWEAPAFAAIFSLALFLAFCVFLVSAVLFVGSVERILSLGIKPGAYPVGSLIFFRWLVLSGLHLWMIHLVLPFWRGTNWIKIYLRIAGAKVGRESFLNTSHFYDPYLLTIGDGVIIGGETFVSCHLFEAGHLIISPITIADGTLVGASSYLTPGTKTGVNSHVGMYTYLRRNTEMRDGEIRMTPPGMTIRQYRSFLREKKREKSLA